MSTIDTSMLSGGVRSAYAIATKLKSAPAATEIAEAPKSSFPEMVKEAANNAVETVRYADEAMQAGLRDEIGAQEVVQATLAAEATIKTFVNIRNKVVEAYQEVLRMPV